MLLDPTVTELRNINPLTGENSKGLSRRRSPFDWRSVYLLPETGLAAQTAGDSLYRVRSLLPSLSFLMGEP